MQAMAEVAGVLGQFGRVGADGGGCIDGVRMEEEPAEGHVLGEYLEEDLLWRYVVRQLVYHFNLTNSSLCNLPHPP